MENKNMLSEVNSFNFTPSQIIESIQKNNGALIVSGILLSADIVNQNGRYYPRPILEREFTKYQSLVKNNAATGELDHPDSTVINLKNVSHKIVEMHWDGNDIVGTIQVLTTPSGNILKELFKNGVKIGISSRGLGSVKESEKSPGQVVVQDDYELIGWDFVSNPSNHGSWMHIVESAGASPKPVYKYAKLETIITKILCGE